MSDLSIWSQSGVTPQLVQAAAQGDQQAVQQLLERHRDPLRRLIHFRLDRRVRSRVDASDVVQDVLLEASHRLRDYATDPKLPFHLWLRQLAQDRMIDLHRRHHAQRRSVDREQPLSRANVDESSRQLAAQLPDMELTPMAATIQKELEQRCLDSLDLLDETDREVIVMRHIEHLESSEVAAALQLSASAAGMRYLRALRRLRAILTEPPSQA